MIEEIRVRDFQRHRRVVVPLAPGVTTIVGPTDGGKSSLLRALKWVAQNRPRGVKIVRRRGGPARVEVLVDGHRVARSRGKSTNAYSVDGKVHRAFGNEVPAEVAEVLDLSELSFQPQSEPRDGTGEEGLGPSFWFRLSPGEVSRRLNRVVDLSLIDQTLGKLAEGLRAVAAEERVVQARLGEVRAEARRLRPARAAAQGLRRVEGLALRSQEVSSSLDTLRTLIAQGRGLSARGQRARGARSSGSRAVRAGERLAALRARASGVRGLLESGRRAECLASRRPPSTRRLSDSVGPMERHQAQRRNLAALVDSAGELHHTARESRRLAGKLDKKLHRVLAGRRCPLCKREDT